MTEIDQKELRKQLSKLIRSFQEDICNLPVSCPMGEVAKVTCIECETNQIMSLIKSACWLKGSKERYLSGNKLKPCREWEKI